jgi:hypothetical protein
MTEGPGQPSPWEVPPPPPWGPPPTGQWQYGPPAQGTEGMAVAALVLGIIPVFAGLLGIGLGIGALARIKRSGRGGRGLAIAGIVLGAFWLVVIAGAAVFAFTVGVNEVHRDASGALTGRGPVSLKDVRVGDCAATLPTGSHIGTIDVVPCTDPHLGEVYVTYDFDAGPFPGDTEIKRFTAGRCQAALPQYVGATPGETGYRIVTVKPTARSWARGTRHVICLLTAPSHAVLLDSAKGQGPLPGLPGS